MRRLVTNQTVKMPPTLERKVDRILLLLQGNELDENDNGLIGRIVEMDARLRKLESLKNKLIYIIMGMAFAGGYGITELFGKIAESIVKH